MRAKTVNETLGKLLKPKSPEEIRDALKDIKIASYNLKSFFRLIDIEQANILKNICEEKFHMDPYEFDVCRINEAIEKILNIAFTPKYQFYCDEVVLDKTDKRPNSIYYESQYKQFFEYNTKFKLIRFGGSPGSGWSYYWAFPRKEIGNTLFSITDDL